MAEVSYKFNGFHKQMHMDVIIRMTRRFRIRKWLAIRLIRMAAWLLDCNIEVNA